MKMAQNTTSAHVLGARNIAKPLEQQVADRMIERELFIIGQFGEELVELTA